MAALVATELGPCEVLALRCGIDLSREIMQPVRGWTDDEWAAAQDRLAMRGLLDRGMRATPAGSAAYAEVEDLTDRAASGPWLAVGVVQARRAIELLTPIARACHAVLPTENPVGLPPLPPQ